VRKCCYLLPCASVATYDPTSRAFGDGSKAPPRSPRVAPRPCAGHYCGLPGPSAAPALMAAGLAFVSECIAFFASVSLFLCEGSCASSARSIKLKNVLGYLVTSWVTCRKGAACSSSDSRQTSSTSIQLMQWGDRSTDLRAVRAAAPGLFYTLACYCSSQSSSDPLCVEKREKPGGLERAVAVCAHQATRHEAIFSTVAGVSRGESPCSLSQLDVERR
jgi:hypothetical protein